MNTIRDWAEYYYKNLHLWVCAETPRGIDWADWRNVHDIEYISRFNATDWERAKGIEVILGKKGLMGLHFEKAGETSYDERLYHTYMKTLGLPEDYVWVVESPYRYYIFVDVALMPKGYKKNYYNHCGIWYEDSLHLPHAEGSKELWFRNGIPLRHPVQFKWDDLSRKIDKIGKMDFEVASKGYLGAVADSTKGHEGDVIGCLSLVAIFFIGVIGGNFLTWKTGILVTILLVVGLLATGTFSSRK